MFFGKTWEDEATMSKPSSEPAIDHEGKEDDRVDLVDTNTNTK